MPKNLPDHCFNWPPYTHFPTPQKEREADKVNRQWWTDGRTVNDYIIMIAWFVSGLASNFKCMHCPRTSCSVYGIHCHVQRYAKKKKEKKEKKKGLNKMPE